MEDEDEDNDDEEEEETEEDERTGTFKKNVSRSEGRHKSKIFIFTRLFHLLHNSIFLFVSMLLQNYIFVYLYMISCSHINAIKCLGLQVLKRI